MNLVPKNQRRQGMAVIVVLALLAIILLYVSVNIRTLSHLQRDLQLIEKKQQQHLLTSPPGATNTAAVH
jgi:hypothetical protein